MSQVRNSSKVLLSHEHASDPDNALEIAGKSFRDILDVNTFEGTTQFRAVVLTDSVEVTADAYRNTSGLNLSDSDYSLFAAGDPKENHYQVRCRIVEENSPHQSIPPPSSLSGNPEDAQLIALHQTFTTRSSVKDARQPIAGDVVWVTYEKGPDDGRLQKGQILDDPIAGNQGGPSSSPPSAAGAAGGAGGAFGNAGYNPQWTGPVMAPAEVAAMAEKVDTPGTPENKCYELAKSETSKNLDLLHPMFLPYVKTFIARCCAELNVLVYVTSGFRTFEHQKRLKAENANNASPGNSPHNFGIAIDMCPFQYDAATNSKGKILANKASGKAAWDNTGCPKLWHSMGGFWKHTFSSGYRDPVHFDMKFGMPIVKGKAGETWKSLKQQQNVAGNEVDPRDSARFKPPGGALASKVTPSGAGGDGAPPEGGE